MPQVALSNQPPNRRLQLTPLRGRKIVRILEAEFVPVAISIYEAAQLKRRTLGRIYLEPAMLCERELLFCAV
jgi:hypothetical protein